jgi:ParB-like chromosome segregation protein Spo0J
MRLLEVSGSGKVNRAGRIRIVYCLIVELKLNPKNPRVHSPRQLRLLARSIETFGFNVPVLIDLDGKVIAGHGRKRRS